MSIQDFTRDWVPFRDALLTTYPKLTDADLQDADGSVDVLAKRIADAGDGDVPGARAGLVEFLSGPLPSDAYAMPTHDNAAMQDSGDYVAAGEDPSDDDARFGDDGKADTPVGRAS